MSLEKNKNLLNKELDKFNSILGEILPRYISLMKKKSISLEEEKELGEIEHFLIEINAKVTEIKMKLDQDLFGETMNLFYKVKEEAKKGDAAAEKRVNKMREVFLYSIRGDEAYFWN